MYQICGKPLKGRVMDVTLTGEKIHLHKGAPTACQLPFSFDSMGNRNGPQTPPSHLSGVPAQVDYGLEQNP